MKFLFVLLSSIFPVTLLAQVGNVFDAEDLTLALLEKLGYFFLLLAIFVFFWGLVKFIKNAADTKEHENGKHLIIWGLISFLILVSIWEIVRLVLVDTLGINAAKVCYIDSMGGTYCPL